MDIFLARSASVCNAGLEKLHHNTYKVYTLMANILNAVIAPHFGENRCHALKVHRPLYF